LKNIVIAISLVISTLAAQIYKVGDSVSDFSGSLCPEGNQSISLNDYNGIVNGGNYHVIWLVFFNSTSRSCQLEAAYTQTINPAVTINFALQDKEFTQISVYNILGEKVDDLAAATFPPGFHYLQWNATEFPTGVYFIQLLTPSYQQTRKIMYLK